MVKRERIGTNLLRPTRFACNWHNLVGLPNMKWRKRMPTATVKAMALGSRNLGQKHDGGRIYYTGPSAAGRRKTPAMFFNNPIIGSGSMMQFVSFSDNLAQAASGDFSNFLVRVSAQHAQLALPPIASFLRSAVAKNSKLASFCPNTRGRTSKQLGNLAVGGGAQQGDGGWRPKCFP